MAILSVREIWNGSVAEIDDSDKRKYQRIFRITMSTLIDSAFVANFGPGAVGVVDPVTGLSLPNTWDPYVDAQGNFDLGVFAKRRSARNEGEYTWLVTVEYDSELNDPNKQAENPLARPPIYTFRTEKFSMPITFAYLDQAQTKLVGVINSAGEYFDPPVEVEDSRFVFSVTRNEAAFDPTISILYVDTVNADVFFGFQPGFAKCQRIDGVEKYENGLAYWEVTYEFLIKKAAMLPGQNALNTAPGWAIQIVDAGYHVLDSGGNIQVATDPRGQPFSSPAMLNGSGKLLGGGVFPLPQGTVPVVATLFWYPQQTFGNLNLGGGF